MCFYKPFMYKYYKITNICIMDPFCYDIRLVSFNISTPIISFYNDITGVSFNISLSINSFYYDISNQSIDISTKNLLFFTRIHEIHKLS